LNALRLLPRESARNVRVPHETRPALATSA
jgi:hypothetical protein